MIESFTRRCLECNEELEGRIDRKFCTEYCRSSYHYRKNKRNQNSLFRSIDKQLKLNRRILKLFNKAGKATVRKEVLLDHGFDPSYFTHYWKNSKGQVYLFCYEHGFSSLRENDREKYVLVRWQDYMRTAISGG